MAMSFFSKHQNACFLYTALQGTNSQMPLEEMKSPKVNILKIVITSAIITYQLHIPDCILIF